jgi:flagellin
MIINHNISSLNTLDRIFSNGEDIKKSLEKLSSGLRIVTADDDASGLSISEGMRAQVNGLSAARLNSQEGLSALRIAEGGLGQQQQILQRMNTLAVRAANDLTLSTTNIGLMQSEVDQLRSEFTRVQSVLNYNGKALLGGAFSGNLQVGEGTTANDQINVNLTALAFDVTTVDLTGGNAVNSIAAIKSGIDELSSTRGTVGALMNRLTNTVQTLGVQIQNVTASESRIRDVDMAAEMSNFTRLQILQQSGMSMLAQANSQPQAVLSLLR